MRVEVRGKVYDSVPTCAKALGVSDHTVYCAVSRRTTDTLGLGKGNRTARRGGRPKKRVKIGNVEFPSMREASRQLGFAERYVQNVLSRGGQRAREALVVAAMRYQARQDMGARS